MRGAPRGPQGPHGARRAPKGPVGTDVPKGFKLNPIEQNSTGSDIGHVTSSSEGPEGVRRAPMGPEGPRRAPKGPVGTDGPKGFKLNSIEQNSTGSDIGHVTSSSEGSEGVCRAPMGPEGPRRGPSKLMDRRGSN